MKNLLRYVLTTVSVLVLYAANLQACDVCGCSVNANYFGILPQFRQHFVGVRYMNNNLRLTQIPSLFDIQHPTYTESLQRAEIWGRYYPTKRIQLFAFIPYQYNQKNEGGVLTEAGGLSDISVMGNYILLNSGDSGRLSWRHTLSLGGGIKIPTGKFDPAGAPALQTGTGTWDYMLNAIYTTRYKKIGLNADVNVRLNSSNGDYQYGNRFTSSLRFFYWHKYKLVSVLPHIGLLSEFADNDRKYDFIQKYTGGTGYYASSGVDVYLKNVSLGFIFSVPISENLNAGYAQTNNRLSVQLLYLFN